MHKRKPIKLRFGCGKKVCEELGITRVTLAAALNYRSDTDLQQRVRDYVFQKKYVKRF